MDTRESDNLIWTTRGALPRASLIMATVVEEGPTAVTVAVEWRVRGEDPQNPGHPAVGGEIVRRDAFINANMPGQAASVVAAPLGG